MMIKKCIVCGEEFEAKDNRNKICSEECKKESYRRNTRNSKARKNGENVPYSINVSSKYTYIESWIDKYNASGYRGGNAMLAHECGMTYEQWMKQSMTERILKREAILNGKRTEHKRLHTLRKNV